MYSRIFFVVSNYSISALDRPVLDHRIMRAALFLALSCLAYVAMSAALPVQQYEDNLRRLRRRSRGRIGKREPSGAPRLPSTDIFRAPYTHCPETIPGTLRGAGYDAGAPSNNLECYFMAGSLTIRCYYDDITGAYQAPREPDLVAAAFCRTSASVLTLSSP